MFYTVSNLHKTHLVIMGVCVCMLASIGLLCIYRRDIDGAWYSSLTGS